MEKEDFLREGYRFYPKNIYDTTRSYFLTHEFKNRTFVIHQNKKSSIAKIETIQDIISSTVETESVVERMSMQASVAFIVHVNKESSIVVYISLLVPYYSIYYFNQAEIIDYFNIENHIRFSRPKDFETIYDLIEIQIKKNFKHYNLFPENLVNIELENISFNARGVLPKDLEILKENDIATLIKPFNLFNAFFSTEYFI